MEPSTPRRRARALATAVLFLPLPAHAATYDLSNTSVNVATAPYTSADTLNTSSVTFISTPAGGSLVASVNLLGNTTVGTSGGLTLAGPLSGSATLFKGGTGTLTLSAQSPSFTGPLTLNSSGGTLRLATESPLAGTAPVTFNSSTTLDLNGFNSLGRSNLTFSGGISILNNNTTNPSTFSPALPAQTPFTLGGAGSLTLTSPLQGFYNTFTKTGTGTLTLAAPTPSFGYFNVVAGTLAYGVPEPFSTAAYPSAMVAVASGASLDLNGFNFPGGPATFSYSFATGSALVNNNRSTPSTVSTLPAGIVVGGAGNTNLTAKVASLTKTGTGILNLNTTNTTFSGNLTVNDGTVCLNAPSAAGSTTSGTGLFNLNGSPTTGGILDLNGYPAPRGNYYFNNGSLYNNNTASTSTIDTSTAYLGALPGSGILLGGEGDIAIIGNLPSSFYKVGNGTLTLSPPNPASPTVTALGGTLRLGNTNLGGTFKVYGNSQGYPFRAGVIDLNGLILTRSLHVTLYNNAGFVNNNTSTPATLDQFVTLGSPGYYVWPPDTYVLGGDGTLNVTSTAMSGHPIAKVGAGLLTLPAYFNSMGFQLRAGTLQVETNDQLGGTNGGVTSFLGGTLRVAPLHLPAQSSYTFNRPVTVDPAGGTIDAQRNTTLTGLLTGTGPLAKLGTGTLTLNPSPDSRLALSVQTGSLILRPADTSAPTTLTSLDLSPGTLLDFSSSALVITQSPPPAATIRQYLHDNQLTHASADATHSLAYLDTGTSLLIQLTLTGDANLDGLLTPDDYALLDKGFLTSGSLWQQGDFNYDGTVTAADYLLLDSTHAKLQGGLVSPTLLSQRASQFGREYVAELLTAIPEPCLALTSILYPLSSLLFKRRRDRLSNTAP